MPPKAAFPGLPAVNFAPIPAAGQPLASCLLWVEVARGGKRASCKHSTPTNPDAYLNVRISKLRHYNVAFPRRNDVYTLAYRICTCLSPFKMSTCFLQEAIDFATSDQRLLHDDIVRYIVTLYDLMRQASLHPAA